MNTTAPNSGSSSGSPHSNPSVLDLPGFTHCHAEVNGTRIHYVVGGKGPTVLLLHGWPYTWVVWGDLMPLLAEAGFTVIAPDLRGLGESAPAEAGYDKANVAEDVRQIVRLYGTDPVNLVGMDIGAMVAYAYASRNPAEVRRLVLAESVIPGFGLEELMNPATGGYWHFGFHMQVGLAAMLTAGKEEAYLTPLWQMMSTSPDAVEQARSFYLPYYSAPGGMLAGFQHYGTLLEDGKQNRAVFRSKLRMPVLVLSGERGIPHAQTLGSVQRVVDNIEASIVPESGHLFAHDNPGWVAATLKRFLA
jgi:pimeloyl-ACP methyl ester carboxylesterase